MAGRLPGPRKGVKMMTCNDLFLSRLKLESILVKEGTEKWNVEMEGCSPL